MTGTAAFLRNGRLDILAANQLGSALYAPAFGDPVRPVNLARFIFLDAKSTEFYGDWGGIAHGREYRELKDAEAEYRMHR